MNSQEYRNLQEAYLDVYENEQLDEAAVSWNTGKTKSGLSPEEKTTLKFVQHGLSNKPQDQKRAKQQALVHQNMTDAIKKTGKRKVDKVGPIASKRFKNAAIRKRGGKEPSVPIKTVSGLKDANKESQSKLNKEQVDLYDIILSHLLDEGYAETPEAAEVMIANMSEEWRDDILNEGIGSAIRGLFGKKKEPEAPKPLSRGAELRARYNTGPDKSETSAKRKILDKTRARAERDEKEYGDSTYSKSVATKSREAHDRYLRAGYNKYGADRSDSGGMGGSGGSGSGNKARKRAVALNNSYDLFDYMMEYLMIEGYANTNENALVIMANMSEEWRESIVEAKKPLPVAKMRDKENRMREEPYTPGETKDSTLDHNRRLGNIEDVRRSVSTRGGKRAMMNPMPDVRRPKNRDED